MAKKHTNSYEVPEQLLAKYKVGEKDRQRIKAVKAYDLSFATEALTDDLIRVGRSYSVEQAYPLALRFGKADLRLARRLEIEFKRFCILTLVKAKVPHAPAGAVDMYWHFLILHTTEYTDFCQKVWGDFKGDPRFRHHYPSTDETRRGMLDAYKNTRSLYVEVFGEPELFQMDALPGAERVASRTIWEAESSTSGDSYSGVMNPTKQE